MGYRSIAVLGIGNVLLGDDAFGPTVVELLRARYALGAGTPVTLLDVGTPGLSLPVHLAGHDAVILVDSVADAGENGEVRLYRRDDLDRLPPKARTSAHDPAVQESLWLADLAGEGPREIVLVGAIAAGAGIGEPMSERMRRACDDGASLVLAELARMGARPVERPEPLSLAAWWL